jgi:hypothetical protein
MKKSDKKFIQKMNKLIFKAILNEQELTFSQDVVERLLRIIEGYDKFIKDLSELRHEEVQ